MIWINTERLEAETEEEEKKDKGRVLRSERRTGRYLRRFALGPDIADDKVEAHFTDGVLHLSVPKQAPETPPKRQIDIK